MPTNPYEYCPNDTICVNCGDDLPEDWYEKDTGTPEWDGFCSEACRDEFDNARIVPPKLDVDAEVFYANDPLLDEPYLCSGDRDE